MCEHLLGDYDAIFECHPVDFASTREGPHTTKCLALRTKGPTPPQRNGDRRLAEHETDGELHTKHHMRKTERGESAAGGGEEHRRRNGKREVVITPCTSQSAQQEPDGAAHCPAGGQGQSVGPGLTGP